MRCQLVILDYAEAERDSHDIPVEFYTVVIDLVSPRWHGTLLGCERYSLSLVPSLYLYHVMYIIHTALENR